MPTEILILALGWLFGLLSPGVARSFDRRQKAREIGRGILRELNQLRHTLGTVAFRLRQRAATLDADFIEWYRDAIASDKELDEDPDVKKAFQEVLSLPVEHLNRSIVGKSLPGFSPRAVSYQLPFVQAHIGNLDLFPVDFQEKVLRARHYLDLYNAEVELAKSMFDKTFDASIVDASRAAVETNLDIAYANMARRAGRLARDLGAIIDAYATRLGARQ